MKLRSVQWKGSGVLVTFGDGYSKLVGPRGAISVRQAAFLLSRSNAGAARSATEMRLYRLIWAKTVQATRERRTTNLPIYEVQRLRREWAA